MNEKTTYIHLKHPRVKRTSYSFYLKSEFFEHYPYSYVKNQWNWSRFFEHMQNYLHNLDGPALIRHSREDYEAMYWIHGKFYYYRDWLPLSNKLKFNDKLKELTNE